MIHPTYFLYLSQLFLLEFISILRSALLHEDGDNNRDRSYHEDGVGVSYTVEQQ
jgi:hypothetical protein